MTLNPTGDQYEIRFGSQWAVVTEVGATLRRYTVGDRDLINGFEADQSVKGGRGQTLLPWPNRLRDGRYTFDGTEQQLALSEPARHNASHGLVRYVAWTVQEHLVDRVSLRVRVYPQTGWPGTLEAIATYRLDDDGLSVELRATNLGTGPLPFGYAAHPYLSVGESTVDEVRVRVPARSFLTVDDRLLPVALEPVDGTANDLREAPVLGDRVLDVAMTGLERDTDGRWRVTVEHGDRSTELWGDEAMGWVQVFTGGPYRTWGVAVEPMSCGPDAFNPGPTHDDLRVLAPGDSFVGRWGIRGR